MSFWMAKHEKSIAFSVQKNERQNRSLTFLPCLLTQRIWKIQVIRSLTNHILFGAVTMKRSMSLHFSFVAYIESELQIAIILSQGIHEMYLAYFLALL